MIPLVIKAIPSNAETLEHVVVRLVERESDLKSVHDFHVRDMPNAGSIALSRNSTIYFPEQKATDIVGDVLLLEPCRQLARRLIRKNSQHNTFLVTEQCDQLCIMCSQPPKKHHQNLYDEYTQAAILAPPNSVLGISGGEPLLHKADLFKFLENVLSQRPDIQFHILTNGQHFSEDDLTLLTGKYTSCILWGVPIYSNYSKIHNEIVGKENALEQLVENLSILSNAGARLELRTVIMRQNLEKLPSLARFLSKHLGGSEIWAIMQLENIGYARKNWESIFADTSVDFTNVASALRIAGLAGLNVQLYNFPLCTVPIEFRDHAIASISDWKNKFISECVICNARDSCGGFFEWYDQNIGFVGVKAL